MRIELRDFRTLSASDMQAYLGLRAKIDFGCPAYAWVAPEDRPVRLFAWDGDDLIAHVGIMDRTIAIQGLPVHVAGIFTVMTDPDRQGAGIGSAVVRASIGEIQTQFPSADHIVLVCLERRVAFYERLGWHRITTPVIIAQPDGPAVISNVMMRRSFDGHTWPDGDVDLCGLPW